MHTINFSSSRKTYNWHGVTRDINMQRKIQTRAKQMYMIERLSVWAGARMEVHLPVTWSYVQTVSKTSAGQHDETYNDSNFKASRLYLWKYTGKMLCNHQCDASGLRANV